MSIEPDMDGHPSEKISAEVKDEIGMAERVLDDVRENPLEVVNNLKEEITTEAKI